MIRLGILVFFLLSLPLRAEPINVFAAASLRNALDAIVEAYGAVSEDHIVVSYAGSSALARQIGYGAPADLFVSAHPRWMEVLSQEGHIRTQSRFDLAGNRLVLISSRAEVSVDLDNPLPEGRLAMGFLNAVPAGIYGKQALTQLGRWQEVAPRVVQTDSVRAALALVALGEAPWGIVYATDALAEPRVWVAATFPPESHDAIRYPVALTKSADPQAEAFAAFLQSETARDILGVQGFLDPRAP